MRRRIIAALLGLGLTTTAAGTALDAVEQPTAQAAGGPCAAWMDPHRSADERAHALVRAMDQDQKLHMLTFGDPPWFTYYGSAGHVTAIPELCVPALNLSDAGSGVAGLQVATTLFPSGVAQAATWDPATQRAVGDAIGAEAHDKGINVMLGPGMNTDRTPYNGRNFEYFGEDPYLSARTAVAFIRGIQSNPVIADAKHFVLNDQETDRNSVDVRVDDRTLHEIYLPAFEAAVKKAHVGSVMCSYNRVRTAYACQNPQLLDGILRKQWGFQGFVVSDWGAVHSTVPSVRAGLDLEMNAFAAGAPPTPVTGSAGRFYAADKLRAALAAHQVTQRQVDTMVTNIVRPMFAQGLFEHPVHPGAQPYLSQASTPQHVALSRRAAAEATVLLKNRTTGGRGLLPLDRDGGHTIAVIGYAANPYGATNSVSGGGSSRSGVPPRIVSPLEGITAQAAAHGDRVVYTEGDTPADAALAASQADYVVVVATDSLTEGADRPDLSLHPGTCATLFCENLPLDQEQMIAATVRANPRTTVVLDVGAPVRMPWLAQAGAVLVPWYGGAEHGNALAGVLYGDQEPGGRLPQTFPVDEKQARYKAAQYPGVGGVVRYSEKLLVGYRWYDAERRRPLFPFGFGLGYTTFDYSGLRVRKAAHGSAVATFRVRNTGSRRGSAVPQLYVGFPRRVGEPPKQLKGYTKLTLDPGQARQVTLRLDRRAFSYWKDARTGWTVAPGDYRVLLATSARDVLAGRTVHWG